MRIARDNPAIALSLVIHVLVVAAASMASPGKKAQPIEVFLMTDVQRTDSRKLDTQRTDFRKTERGKTDIQRTDTQKADVRRVDANTDPRQTEMEKTAAAPAVAGAPKIEQVAAVTQQAAAAARGIPRSDPPSGAQGNGQPAPPIFSSATGKRGGGPIETTFGTGEGPRFIHREAPAYPLQARRFGKEGRVLLRLTLDETGRLLAVDIVEDGGYGFAASAVEAVKKSTFSPARMDGSPVAAKALLPVRFALKKEE